jgi:hypothetical protein
MPIRVMAAHRVSSKCQYKAAVSTCFNLQGTPPLPCQYSEGAPKNRLSLISSRQCFPATVIFSASLQTIFVIRNVHLNADFDILLFMLL